MSQSEDGTGSIEIKNAGVYRFELTEVDGQRTGVTYDETVYKLNVTVEEKEGKLVVSSYSIIKDGYFVSDETITFHNTIDTGKDDYYPIIIPTIIGKDTGMLNKTDHFAYVIGYPDGTVHPNGQITRAEVATILDRLMKDQVKARFDSKPTVNFSDVSSGAWYYDAVQMCAKAGIVAGYPDGSFKPNQAVTRAEFFKMVAMLYSDTLNTPITGGIFKDINGHWAEKYINLLQKLGIVKGDNGSARPNDNLTRGETAAVMNRILGRVVNNSSFSDAKVAAAMKTWPDCTSSHWAYAEIQEATNSHDYTWDINILTYSDHNGIFKAFIENLKNPVTERWTYIKK